MTNSPAGPVEDPDVARRLAALEAENASLRARLDDGGPHAPEPDRPRRARGRGLLAMVLIVIAALLVPVSIVSAWARVELIDESAFVATFAPLADDPAVQALVVDQTTAAIESSLDLEGLTNDLFDGIAGLELPPRAASAIDLLRGPASEGLRGLVSSSVTQFVASDLFASVWASALRASHRGLVAAATGTTPAGAVIVSDTGEVGISLAPIIDEVKERLIAQGIGFASAIPSIDRTVVLVQNDALVSVRIVYGAAATVGWWLPVLTLALFAAGILAARRRRVALVGTGVAIALGATVLAVTLAIGATVATVTAARLGLSLDAVDAIYAQVVHAMHDTAMVFVVIGVLLAILAWLQGRSRFAAATRAGATSVNDRLRSGMRARGVDTGRVGRWLYSSRTLVRVIIATLAILLLVALRPLSIGDVILVLVVALALWWVCEVAQTPARDDSDGHARAGSDPARNDDARSHTQGVATERTGSPIR